MIHTVVTWQNRSKSALLSWEFVLLFKNLAALLKLHSRIWPLYQKWLRDRGFSAGGIQTGPFAAPQREVWHNLMCHPVHWYSYIEWIGKICYVRKNATPISRASTSPSTAEPSATSPSVAMGSSLHLRNQVWSKSFYRVTHHVDSNLPLTSKLKLRFSTWASY